MNEKKIIELRDVAKSYDDEIILDHINLDVHEKEFMTLLGPSGCGKTTTLRIIAGFVTPDTGDVVFEGTKINDVPAYKRHVNTVFQKYASFPHLNVYENIAFALRLKKISEEEIYNRVEEMLEVKVKVAQLCSTLCDPMGYSVHGILQARILEWVAFPFSRGSSQPRDQT